MRGFNKKKRKLIKLRFESIFSMNMCYYSIYKKKNIAISSSLKIGFECIEFNIPTLFKFLSDKDISLSNWLHVTSKETSNKITKCDKEYLINMYSIKNCTNEKLKILGISIPSILSLDIEVVAYNESQMPKACNKTDIFFMNGFHYRDRKGIVTKYCIHIKESELIEGVVMIQCKNEQEVINKTSNLINKLDPDVLLTYNGLGFDYPYINAKQTRFYFKDWANISRLQNYKVRMKNISWKSSAYNEVNLSWPDTPGRIHIDLLPIIKRDYKLTTYKLGKVSEHFLGENKEDLSPQELFQCYKRGTKEDIKIIASYCVQDTALPLKLFDKLNIWINLSQMSNIMRVPMFDIFTRGQGIRSKSQIHYEAHKSGYYMRKTKIRNVPFEGGYVFTPNPGLYTNVFCFDFAHLYPAMIIAYNICYTTFVDGFSIDINDIIHPIIRKIIGTQYSERKNLSLLTKDYWKKKIEEIFEVNNVIITEFSENYFLNIDRLEITKKLIEVCNNIINNMNQFQIIDTINVIIIAFEHILINKLNQNINKGVSNNCFIKNNNQDIVDEDCNKIEWITCMCEQYHKKRTQLIMAMNTFNAYKAGKLYVLDEFQENQIALYQSEARLIKKYKTANKETCTDLTKCPQLIYNRNRYIKRRLRHGLLPILCQKLTDDRNNVKKLMKTEKDQLQYLILDKTQNAIKTSSNSIYGALGSVDELLSLKQGAVSITAMGRKSTNIAATIAKNTIWKVDVVENHIYKFKDHNIIYTTDINKFKHNCKSLIVENERETTIFMKKIEKLTPTPQYGYGYNHPNKLTNLSNYKFTYIIEIEKLNFCSPCEVVYGDSVTGDTPILIKKNNKMLWKQIKDIYNETEVSLSEQLTNLSLNKYSKQYKSPDIQIWSDKGWTNIKKVMKHKTKKKIYGILTHTGYVKVTEDHSLLSIVGYKLKPSQVKVGYELLHNNLPILKPNKEIDAPYSKGLFLADGSCGIYPSERYGTKYSWVINNQNLDFLNKAKDELNNVYDGVSFKILDTMKSSHVYKLVSVGKVKSLVLQWRVLFYADKFKKVPDEMFEAFFKSREIFFQGYYDGDGNKKGPKRFDMKGMIGCAGLYHLVQSLGYKASVNDRKTKPNIYRINITKNKQRKSPIKIKKIVLLHEEYNDYVYDFITKNHHFSAGIGKIVVHNTDSTFNRFPKIPIVCWPLLVEDFEKVMAKIFPEDVVLEFEDIFHSFIIYAKKKYMAIKMKVKRPLDWFIIDENYTKIRGLNIIKRDNCKLAQKICKKVNLDVLQFAKYNNIMTFIIKCIKKMSLGSGANNPYTIKDYIIVKKISASYALEAFPMKLYGQHLLDEGILFLPGDRLEYVFKQGDYIKQGYKMESPGILISKNLKIDYIYYIERQLAKEFDRILITAFPKQHPQKYFEKIYVKHLQNVRKSKKMIELFRPYSDIRSNIISN